jgi:hypothetical protein
MSEQGNPGSTAENEKVALSFLESLSAGKIDAALGLIADDAQEVIVGSALGRRA